MLTAPTPASSTAALTCGHWSIEDNPHGTCGLRFHEDARTAISATAIGYAWLTAPGRHCACGLPEPVSPASGSLHDLNLLIATLRT